MRCALEISGGAPPVSVDGGEPAVRASVELNWRGRQKVWSVDCLVDTGCPVDFIASPRLVRDLRATARPARMARLDWGGNVSCEIFKVAARLVEWCPIEVYAPLDAEFEDLLGLPAILRSNLCIRGLAGSAYWVDLPAEGRGSEFIARVAGGPKRSRIRRRKG